jgi:hypothetical protein
MASRPAVVARVDGRRSARMMLTILATVSRK